jgi:hypothetical protein
MTKALATPYFTSSSQRKDAAPIIGLHDVERDCSPAMPDTSCPGT